MSLSAAPLHARWQEQRMYQRRWTMLAYHAHRPELPLDILIQVPDESLIRC